MFKLTEITCLANICLVNFIFETRVCTHTHITYLVDEQWDECLDWLLIIKVFAKVNNFLTVVAVVECTCAVPVNRKSFSALYQHQPIIGNCPVGCQTRLIFFVSLDTIRFVKTEGREGGYSSQESLVILGQRCLVEHCRRCEIILSCRLDKHCHCMHSDQYTSGYERIKSQMVVKSFYWDNLIAQTLNTFAYYPKCKSFWEVVPDLTTGYSTDGLNSIALGERVYGAC